MFQYHSIIIINNNSVSVIFNSISVLVLLSVANGQADLVITGVADLLGDTLFERYTHQELLLPCSLRFFNFISHQSHFGLYLSIILLIYLSLCYALESWYCCCCNERSPYCERNYALYLSSLH